MQKMLTVTIRRTGHLVGAMTRNSNPEKAPSADELLPKGLTMRDAEDGTDRFQVPQSALLVTSVDEVINDALLSPSDYQLKDGKAEMITKGPPGLPAVPVTTSGVKVTVPAPGKQEIWVLVQPQAGGDPLQAGATAPELAAQTDVTVGLAVPHGNYRLAVWLQNHPAQFKDNINV